MELKEFLYVEQNGYPVLKAVFYNKKNGTIRCEYTHERIWEDSKFKKIEFHRMKNGKFIITPILNSPVSRPRVYYGPKIIVDSLSEATNNIEGLTGIFGNGYFTLATTSSERVHKIVRGNVEGALYVCLFKQFSIIENI